MPQVGHRWPHDHRAVAEHREQDAGHPHRFGWAAGHEDEALGVHPRRHVQPGSAGHVVGLVDDGFRLLRRGRPDDDRDHLGVPPAHRGRPGQQGILGLTGQQGVDQQRLEAGIPRPAFLRGTRVHPGRRERNLAGVAQDVLAQQLFLARVGQFGHGVLDDFDGYPHGLDDLLQCDGPDELAGGATKHHRELPRSGRDRPLDERVDTLLDYQPYRGAVLGRQVAKPGQRRVHPGDRADSQPAAGP